MKRWRYRTGMKVRRKPLSMPKVLWYSFLIFLGFNFMSLWLVDKAITPIIKDVAKTEVKRIATEAIDEAVYKNIRNQVDLDELIIEKKRDGLPSTYSFNPKVYYDVLTLTTKDIEKRLGIKHMDDKSSRNINDVQDAQIQNIVYKIPLGVATGNSLLANFGPEIPVELSLVRDVESKFRTVMTDGGINNTLLELFVDFELDIQIVIPYFSDEEPIKFQAKIGDIFIPGEVPEYYSNGGSLPPPVKVETKKKEVK
ncbi:sporulation protein YunB [Bacillus massiliigorillae]|uniref:sporulation protein YunB n=1 Tax=Bacillus massiliigorillae TaxID=1243664 RepID=UPI0003A032AC|nr:sporulation protein YunB [Bacillus massiliigorillae]